MTSPNIQGLHMAYVTWTLTLPCVPVFDTGHSEKDTGGCILHFSVKMTKLRSTHIGIFEVHVSDQNLHSSPSNLA